MPLATPTHRTPHRWVPLVLYTLALAGCFLSPPRPAAALSPEPGTLSAGTHTVVVLDGIPWQWWGEHYDAMLLGRAQGKSSPAAAVENLEEVIRVAAGPFHALAVKSDGTVWSWGCNSRGALGDGTEKNRKTPAMVQGLPGIASIAAGWQSSFAAAPDGTVWAWGTNEWGQLGLGDRGRAVITPTPVPGLEGVIALAAGRLHTLALKSDGTVWAWGFGLDGQLGTGETRSCPVPAQVVDLAGAAAIAAGEHSMALLEDGTVWQWGFERNKPFRVPLPQASIAIAAGTHSLALDVDGFVWAWGDNTWGQLGDGTRVSRTDPRQVPGLSGIEAIAAGRDYSAAMASDGSIWVWGFNGDGRLGDGTAALRLTPVRIEPAAHAGS